VELYVESRFLSLRPQIYGLKAEEQEGREEKGAAPALPGGRLEVRIPGTTLCSRLPEAADKKTEGGEEGETEEGNMHVVYLDKGSNGLGGY